MFMRVLLESLQEQMVQSVERTLPGSQIAVQALSETKKNNSEQYLGKSAIERLEKSELSRRP